MPATALSTAIPADRRKVILDRLTESGSVSVSALCGVLQVSEDTVRRDLRDLEQAGLLRRVHGGALPPTAPSLPFSVRENRNAPTKQALARIGAGLVQAGQVVLIDSGTTLLELSRCIAPDLEATFITPSPHIAASLAEKGFEVHMLPGRVHPRAQAVVGADCIAALRRVRADLCLLGVCGLDAEAGITAHHIEEAATKQAMVADARQVVAMASADKIGAVAPFFVADAHRVDLLVTDADSDATSALRKTGIRVLNP